MISCVVFFDGRVARVVYDDTTDVVSNTFFQVSVSVSNVSGLISVSKDFGLGLQLLVSKLCMSYFFMKSCKKQLLENGIVK